MKVHFVSTSATYGYELQTAGGGFSALGFNGEVMAKSALGRKKKKKREEWGGIKLGF